MLLLVATDLSLFVSAAGPQRFWCVLNFLLPSLPSAFSILSSGITIGMIAFCSFTMCPVLVITRDEPTTSFLLRSLSIIFITMCAILVIFGPKIHAIFTMTPEQMRNFTQFRAVDNATVNFKPSAIDAGPATARQMQQQNTNIVVREGVDPANTCATKQSQPNTGRDTPNTGSGEHIDPSCRVCAQKQLQQQQQDNEALDRVKALEMELAALKGEWSREREELVLLREKFSRTQQRENTDCPKNPPPPPADHSIQAPGGVNNNSCDTTRDTGTSNDVTIDVSARTSTRPQDPTPQRNSSVAFSGSLDASKGHTQP